MVLAAAGSAQNVRKPIFVTADQLSVSDLLPNPPANESWKTKMELAELHRIEATRTPEQIAHARKDDAEESMFAFADVLGDKLNRTSLPLTALLSDHVRNDAGLVVRPAKNCFKRPRPYHLDTTLKPVCKSTENRADYAFPSGHGTVGFLSALVLIQMLPEKRDAILERAEDYAYSREVCGVHYASDEMASKVVAYATMGVMINNAQFKSELAAAKKELRAALGMTSESSQALK